MAYTIVYAMAKAISKCGEQCAPHGVVVNGQLTLPSQASTVSIGQAQLSVETVSQKESVRGEIGWPPITEGNNERWVPTLASESRGGNPLCF
jgi:hypothetical protein